MQRLARHFANARRGHAALAAAVALSGLTVATTGLGADARQSRGGETAARAAPITAATQLDFDRLGPIRIGMTLAEARRASGQRLPYEDTLSSPGCGAADLTPRSLGVSLGVVEGIVMDIQLRRSPIRVRGGGRIGDTLATLRRLYGARLRRDHPNPYIRSLTRANHRILFSVDGRRPVDVITAGRRPAIDGNSLCT